MQYSELIEKKKHGTPWFPIEHYYIDKTDPRYVMTAHWHKEFEIIRVVSGAFTVYLNNVRYELRGGDCLFVNGGCLKRGEPDNCVYECLVFDTALLERGFGGGAGSISAGLESDELEYKHLIDSSDTEILSTVDALMNTMRTAGELYELKTMSLLYKLFYELHTRGYIVKTHSSAHDRKMHTVTTLLKWIENHSSETITLEKLSKVSNLSEKYLCRIFKEYTSKTVMDYVNESRIEKACSEMRKCSVTEAAFNCGFNDLSYFCKTFKKYKGMTPSEYKKKIISGRKQI